MVAGNWSNTMINATESVTRSRRMLTVCSLAGMLLAAVWATTHQSARVHKPEEFGARHDGVTDDTVAIQRAADACIGGGTLLLASGTYLSGPITLSTDTTLDIEKGSTLLGTTDHNRYLTRSSGKMRPLVGGQRVHDITLTGGGTIDGQGQSWWSDVKAAKAANKDLPDRPRMVEFDRIRHLRVNNLTLQNSPMFHLVPSTAEDVVIDRVRIVAPADSPNTDGIDPTGRDMVISNCLIDVGDDNVALKSGHVDPDHPDAATANITVVDCVFLHGHGLSIGSETLGGVQHVRALRIRFDGTVTAIRIKSARDRGGQISDIFYNDIKIANVGTAVLITDYYPKIPKTDDAQPVTASTPDIHDIHLMNVVASGAKTLGGIYGLPERPIRNVLFTGVSLSGSKGMTVRNSSLTLDHSKLIANQDVALIREVGAEVKGD